MSNRKIWFITGAGRGMGVDEIGDLKAQIDAERSLSTSLAFN